MQVAPVRIRLWRGAAPEVHGLVFTGDVVLSTGYLTMRESSDSPFFAWPATPEGNSVALSVGVDDAHAAADVTVVLDPNGERIPDAGSRNAFVATADHIASISDIDKVLTGHSFPDARLASAIRILRAAASESVSEVRLRYGVVTVVEWLRWLHPAISSDVLVNIGEQVDRSLWGNESAEEAAIWIIAHLATAMGVTSEDFLAAR